MSMIKTNLMIIPMCPREHFALYQSLSRLVLCYEKDWATFLHLSYTCYLLPITNYLITQLSVINNFSACRQNLAENRLSFPSAPRWVRHSYLSKGLKLIPYTCGSSCTYTNKQILAPNAKKGLSIPSRLIARMRSDRDRYKR